MYKYLFALFTFLVVITFEIKAQGVIFNFTDGSQSIFYLDDIRKITYEEDDMLVHLENEILYSWPVNDFKNIEYDIELTEMTENIDNQTKRLTVYPNPGYSDINVDFSVEVGGEVFLQVINFNGEFVLEQNLGYLKIGKHTKSLKVNNLADGEYIIVIQNERKLTQFAKFIKQ